MSLVRATVDAGLGHIELNRPEARNALSRELGEALWATLDAWAERDDLAAVILSGAGGKAFAAGADIAELKKRTHKDSFHSYNQRLFQRVEDFPRPTIAAIDGYALGGGLELTLACDLRVASKSAKVGLPEVSLGIFPGAGGAWRLPRVVGLGRAKELMFTGRIVDADEAFALGLFEQLVETDALGAAKVLGQQIAKNSSFAVQVAKVALNAQAKSPAANALEWLGQGLLLDSPDKDARMTAFLEKRKKA